MNIESFIFFELSLIVAVLGAALAVVAVFYSKNAKRLHDLEAAVYKHKSLAHQRSEEILDEAGQKGQDIIDDATLKATEIIRSADIFQKDVENAFKKEAFDISKELSLGFTQVFEQIRKDQLVAVEKVIRRFEDEAEKEIKDFREILDRETVDAQKIVEQKIEKEYEALKNELVLYRKSQFDKISQEINRITEDLTKQVLGKALNPDQHEELVLKALEEAKKNLR